MNGTISPPAEWRAEKHALHVGPFRCIVVPRDDGAADWRVDLHHGGACKAWTKADDIDSAKHAAEAFIATLVKDMARDGYCAPSSAAEPCATLDT